MGWNEPVWKINPSVWCRGGDKLVLKLKRGHFWSSRDRQAAPGQPSLTKVGLIQSKGNKVLEMDFPLVEGKVLPTCRARKGDASQQKQMHVLS